MYEYILYSTHISYVQCNQSFWHVNTVPKLAIRAGTYMITELARNFGHQNQGERGTELLSYVNLTSKLYAMLCGSGTFQPWRNDVDMNIDVVIKYLKQSISTGLLVR